MKRFSRAAVACTLVCLVAWVGGCAGKTASPAPPQAAEQAAPVLSLEDVRRVAERVVDPERSLAERTAAFGQLGEQVLTVLEQPASTRLLAQELDQRWNPQDPRHHLLTTSALDGARVIVLHPPATLPGAGGDAVVVAWEQNGRPRAQLLPPNDSFQLTASSVFREGQDLVLGVVGSLPDGEKQRQWRLALHRLVGDKWRPAELIGNVPDVGYLKATGDSGAQITMRLMDEVTTERVTEARLLPSRNQVLFCEGPREQRANGWNCLALRFGAGGFQYAGLLAVDPGVDLERADLPKFVTHADPADVSVGLSTETGSGQWAAGDPLDLSPPDNSIAGVRLGDSERQLLNTLGLPDERRIASDTAFWRYGRLGLVVETYPTEGVVRRLELWPGTGATRRGLRAGDPLARFTLLYGPPSSRMQQFGFLFVQSPAVPFEIRAYQQKQTIEHIEVCICRGS